MEIKNGADNHASFLGLRSSDAQIKTYYASAAWRQESPIDDLRRWRKEAPENVVLYAHRADSGVSRITYREYAGHVERFTGALYELGVRPGQVVAIQLPNWWQVNVLTLACVRLGAVVAPIMMTIRERELERVLARVGAGICVTTDRWADFDHAAALAGLAPRLPMLRHRVVLGNVVAPDEVDFVQHFQQTPWEERHPVALDGSEHVDHIDPDGAFSVLFTSGTAGEPKGALHTLNTLHASCRSFVTAENLHARDVFFTPHALTHAFGLVVGNLLPLLTGGSGAIMDTWRPDAGAELVADIGVSILFGSPIFLSALVTTLEEQHRATPSLRAVVAGGTMIPNELVEAAPRVLGVSVRSFYGGTEPGLATGTRKDDPPHWASVSVGRLLPDVELDLRSDQEVSTENPAPVFVRGPGVCMATLGRDSGALVVTAEHDDGWYATGDLAAPDGRGGVRLLGRSTDRIGGAFMIPIADVESALRAHPAIAEVAVVGYPDGTGGELACAVVVARSEPLTLAGVREYLTGLKMTEWYQPSRLEILPQLPYNASGKVQKELLRRWLRGETELSAPEDRGAPENR